MDYKDCNMQTLPHVFKAAEPEGYSGAGNQTCPFVSFFIDNEFKIYTRRRRKLRIGICM